jgi:Acetyltransferase (GNAT) family
MARVVLFEEMQAHYKVPCPPRQTILDGLRNMPSGTEILVAGPDEIVGFAAFSSNYPGPGLESGLFLKELFVSRSHRGRGAGTCRHWRAWPSSVVTNASIGPPTAIIRASGAFTRDLELRQSRRRYFIGLTVRRSLLPQNNDHRPYAAVRAAKRRPEGRLFKCFKCISKLEREMGFEPTTPTLARLCSTPELLPHVPVCLAKRGLYDPSAG